MQTSKKWEKISDSSFKLWDQNEPIATMEISRNTSSRTTTVSYNGEKIMLEKTGFWKNHIEVKTSENKSIAKIYPEKWYAHSYILETNGNAYKLRIRNNPLAEWVLKDKDKEILAYGLNTQDGKPTIKITTAPDEQNYLFDIILWYQFLPIASEQGADDYTFLLLIA